MIGAHPHVLQPIRQVGPRRLVAYSLGNFVFGAGSPGTTSTGILELELSARGVEGSASGERGSRRRGRCCSEAPGSLESAHD